MSIILYQKNFQILKINNGNGLLDMDILESFYGINKFSYIDSFIDRSVNAFNFVEQIRYALEGKNCWYLN